MPTYFKPLRRKLGVVTLVMACVLAGWWVRSLRVVDMISFGPIGTQYTVSSASAKIALGILFLDGAEWNDDFWFSRDLARENPDEPYSGTFATRCELFGFEYKYCPEINLRIRAVPYWSIVIPLTLLSAWLLLSKPRAGKTSGPTQS